VIPPCAVVVLWHERGDRESLLCQVFDRVAGEQVPMVVLCGEPEAMASRVPAGVLVRARRADAALVSVMLRTLHERQFAVEALRREQNAALHAQAGLAHQMEAMQEELTLAAQIQSELIPRCGPSIEGLDLAVICRPAGYVSGDLFEVSRLDDEHVGFFLADAVGHGVPAALLTLLIARSVRMKDASGAIVEPRDVLDALNREMVERNVTGSRFATGVYGVLNMRSGEAVVAGAGHPPPMVVGGRGTRRILTDGPLLGIFDEAVFTQETVRLSAGEALVVFSDGFESAFPRTAEDAYSLRLTNEDYLERLMVFARDCVDAGFEASAARFGETLDAQLGSLHQVDDLTALVLRPRRAKAGREAA
jgi:serine phosphatase RsbU (regulator of sigma subunit)